MEEGNERRGGGGRMRDALFLSGSVERAKGT